MLTAILITLLLAGGGGFAGGYWLGAKHEVNNYFDVQNVQQTAVQNRTQTDVFQGQATVIVDGAGKEFRNVNVNLNSATNITVEFISNRTHFTVTNGVTNWTQ